MIYHVYSLKNRLSGIYEKPFAEHFDSKEYPEMLTQALALADVEALNRHKEYDLYYLGTFDSVSGAIKSQPVEFIVSLEAICLSFISKKSVEKVSENGKEA